MLTGKYCLSIDLTSWLLVSFVDMDKGSPSNWNISTYNNHDEYYNQNEYEVDEQTTYYEASLLSCFGYRTCLVCRFITSTKAEYA